MADYVSIQGWYQTIASYPFELAHHHDDVQGTQTDILIIGEIQNHAKHIEIQEELIKTIQPGCILHELYSKKRLGRTEAMRIALPRLKKWRSEWGKRLIECDMPYNESMLLKKNMLDALIESERLSQESYRTLAEMVHIDSIREHYMGCTIREVYHRSEGPIIAILDTDRVKADSKVHDELRGKRPYMKYPLPVGYAVLDLATPKKRPD